ncbi:putative Acetylxylan esterase [Pillotina sp. SPG140]
MLNKTINFTMDGRVNMRTYILSSLFDNRPCPKRPAIIILPGGAFTFLSDREAEPVALTFAKEGFHTFVLNYSVGDYSAFPNPLDDVSKAIWEVRRNADLWGIEKDSIALMGFSAGACIAAMSATQWNTPGLADRIDAPEDDIKPNAAVIGYGASLLSTIFDAQDEDLIVPPPGKISADRTPELDVVNYVGPHTAPLFFWHNRYDKLVPVINPILMAEAMTKYKLPFEMHIFQKGEHGMSVNNMLSNPSGEGLDPSVSMWVPLCSQWLRSIFRAAV